MSSNKVNGDQDSTKGCLDLFVHFSQIQTASYLADEPGDEQKDQNTVVISTMTEEGVRHEGGEEGYLSV